MARPPQHGGDAATERLLDDDAVRSLVEADPRAALAGDRPVLVDEWQRVPAVWDAVRRAVDDGAAPASFILTGSAVPAALPVHSGAGRIVSLRMRPMSLAERGIETPTVSLRSLLGGGSAPIGGATTVGLADYAAEVVRSGLPGIRDLNDRARRSQLESYIERIVQREFAEAGHAVRRPDVLRGWLAAYAAATATTATYETIRQAAAAGSPPPARATTQPYRDVLQRIWVLDPIAAWLPTRSRLARLSAPPKHHLADPALAASVLGVDVDALVHGAPATLRDGPLLGQLFESLVTLGIRTAAQAAEARTYHLRTQDARHEVDLIVERRDGRVVAIEIKLARDVGDRDVRHLTWLRDQIGDDLLEAVIVTTGPDAYRRRDGVAVVPAALLGP